MLIKRMHAYTGDAGPVWLSEIRIFGVAFYRRRNNRPVSPTCKDIRTEVGVRFGTICFATRRTCRVYKETHKPHFLKESL
jgi:hypothetical protein